MNPNELAGLATASHDTRQNISLNDFYIADSVEMATPCLAQIWFGIYEFANHAALLE
jgi:hypothetical protein